MNDQSDFQISTNWTGQLDTTTQQSTKQVSRIPHGPVADLLMWPVTIILFATGWIWAIPRVPEMLAFEVFPIVTRTVAPLSMVGYWDSETQQRWSMIVPFILLIALTAISRTSLRLASPIVLALGFSASALLLLQVLPTLDALPTSLPEVIVVIVAVGLTVRATVQLPKTQDPDGGIRIPEVLFILLGLSVVFPFAIARVIAGGTAYTNATLFFTHAGVRWQWVTGMSLLIAAWAINQLLPPYEKRPLGTYVVVLVLAIGIGIGFALPRVG